MKCRWVHPPAEPTLVAMHKCTRFVNPMPMSFAIVWLHYNALLCYQMVRLERKAMTTDHNTQIQSTHRPHRQIKKERLAKLALEREALGVSVALAVMLCARGLHFQVATRFAPYVSPCCVDDEPLQSTGVPTT
jgi:hypothetical protein